MVKNVYSLLSFDLLRNHPTKRFNLFGQKVGCKVINFSEINKNFVKSTKIVSLAPVHQ